MNSCYPFVNTPLPYAYNALEPFIDEKTMHLHHDRHLQAYIDNLNKLLEENPSLQKYSRQDFGEKCEFQQQDHHDHAYWYATNHMDWMARVLHPR